jgi:hypothetical protein
VIVLGCVHVRRKPFEPALRIRGQQLRQRLIVAVQTNDLVLVAVMRNEFLVDGICPGLRLRQGFESEDVEKELCLVWRPTQFEHPVASGLSRTKQEPGLETRLLQKLGIGTLHLLEHAELGHCLTQFSTQRTLFRE